MHTGRSGRRPYRGIGSLVVLLVLLGGLAPEVRGHVTTAVGAVACHAVDPASCTDPASATPPVDPQQLAGLSPAQVADQLEGIVAPDEIAELVQLAADGDHDALTDHLAVVVGTISNRAAGVVGHIAGQVVRGAVTEAAAPCEALPSTFLAVGIDLDVHQALGGHTLRRHVGKTDAELHHRLATTTVSAASTFPDKASAEATITAVLDCRAAEVQAWLDGEVPRLTTHARFGHVVGRTLSRDAPAPWPAHGVVIVLDRLAAAPTGYRVTTAFPRIEP